MKSAAPAGVFPFRSVVAGGRLGVLQRCVSVCRQLINRLLPRRAHWLSRLSLIIPPHGTPRAETTFARSLANFIAVWYIIEPASTENMSSFQKEMEETNRRRRSHRRSSSRGRSVGTVVIACYQ